MRINRIDIFIKGSENTHRPYLYNECLDMMNKYRFGGEFRNEGVKFSSMPEPVLKVLDELKIVYQQIVKGEKK